MPTTRQVYGRSISEFERRHVRKANRLSVRRPSLLRALAQQRAEIEYHSLPDVPDNDSSEEDEHAVSPWGYKMLESNTYQNVMALVIIANGVIIGLETDVKGFKYWESIEFLFLSIFILEVALKVHIERWDFFNPAEYDFIWNMFDVLVVGLGLFDFLAGVLAVRSVEDPSLVMLLRSLRLLRVLRILRLLKVLRRLYLLAMGLVEACRAVLWVSVLMSIVLYTCAIVLVRTVGRPPATDPHYEFLTQHFQNIPDSMITLFVLMSSPNLPIYQEEYGMLESRPMFTIFLILFITFGSFGMIAMLTGVINESMFENNELKLQEKRLEHELMRLSLGKRAADLYETLPLDDNACVAVADLGQVAKPAALLLDLIGVNIAHGDILKFLQLMDEHETGSIDMKDFVHAIEKLAEGVSPLAIVEVQHYVGICNDKISKQLSNVTHIIDKVIEIEKHLEVQMKHTSDEVDRILKVTTNGQLDHIAAIEEKMESQLERILQEVDKIVQVVTSSDPLFSTQSLSHGSQPLEDSTNDCQLLKEIQRSESTVLAAIAKQRDDIAIPLQKVIDRRFEDLHAQLLRSVSHRGDVLLSTVEQQPPQQHCESFASFERKDSAPDRSDLILAHSDQNLTTTAGVIESLRLEVVKAVQEAKISTMQEGCMDILTEKVSILAKEVDVVQKQLLSSVAELGGDILSSVSQLISTSMEAIKQELLLQRRQSMSTSSSNAAANMLDLAAQQ